MFELDSRLEHNTCHMGDFSLCRLLLMNESNYVWFILVPRRDAIREIHHLGAADQQQLWQESAALSRWLESSFSYDKLNVAALGNVVSQLHVHHVARTVGDPAWPGPVWGAQPAVPCTADRIEEISSLVRNGSLKECGFKCAD